jgi:NAD(P)-dependent dehydrogenase (short-subunit alcohol dehydrogenase family)
MGQMDGKVVIITGGGTGIGKGIANAFVDEGCSVVIAARNAERLDEAAAELSSDGGTVVAIPTDVTNEEQMISLFAKTMDQFSKLDVLVNNSGAFDGGPIEELTMDQWQRVLQVNVTGPFLGSREAFKIMKKQGGGRIINIGSIAAQKPATVRRLTQPVSTQSGASPSHLRLKGVTTGSQSVRFTRGTCGWNGGATASRQPVATKDLSR